MALARKSGDHVIKGKWRVVYYVAKEELLVSTAFQSEPSHMQNHSVELLIGKCQTLPIPLG